LIIKNFNDLARTDARKLLLEIMESALLEYSPDNYLFQYLKNNDPMKMVQELTVISIGKASVKMAIGAIKFYKNRIKRCIILTNEDNIDISFFGGIKGDLYILKGDHPLPVENSLNSSKKIVDLISNESNPILFLVSGGGSAMLEYPRVNIDEYNRIIKCLMDNGTDIYGLNNVRCCLSNVKCGKLLNYYKGDLWVSLIISDVPGDDPRIISSGPSVPWKYDLDNLGTKILTCKLDCADQVNEFYYKGKLINSIILKNRHFLDYISLKLLENGYEVIDLGSGINMENERLAHWILQIYKFSLESKRDKFAIIGGGETTVKVKGNGKGGRNQELALRVLKGAEGNFTFMAIGTDGVDGNSIAAGAIVDDNDFKSSYYKDIDAYLENNDSFTLLTLMDDAIITGKTGNNVSDIFMLIHN